MAHQNTLVREGPCIRNDEGANIMKRKRGNAQMEQSRKGHKKKEGRY